MENKSTYTGYTEARKRANREWAKKQVQLAIRIPPELKEEIDQHAAERNESLASFVSRAMREQMKRDSINLDEILSE